MAEASGPQPKEGADLPPVVTGIGVAASRWPERLMRLASLQRGEASSARARARDEFLVLLDMVLRQRMRAFARRFRGLTSEDLDDLGSLKLSDLLVRFDSGEWSPARSTAGEVMNFVSAVARNAILDLVRSRSRHPIAPEEEILEMSEPHELVGGMVRCDSPEALVERERFVQALLGCVGALSRRDRATWLLRALLDLPSRAIASHPEVQILPAHVDVVLMRCRARLSACMRSKGFESSPLPQGTFTALWSEFIRPEAEKDSRE